MKKSKFIGVLLLIFLSTSVWSQVIAPVPVVSNDRNWSSSISYDFSGATTSKGVNYFNVLGKPVQSQSWDILTGRVWASEVRYDSFGRAALQSLSAPINTSGSFDYKPDFIRTSAGVIFSNSHFDSSSTLANPSPVGTTANSLGWYYCTLNNLDPYQDITSYPYTRSLYSELSPGTTKGVLGGNKVTVGGQSQWLQSYSFTMAMEVGPLGPSFYRNFSDRKMIKTVSRDVDGVENVMFKDTDGNMMGAARSGGETKYEVFSRILDKGYVDIHIPENCGGTVTFGYLTSNHSLRIFNLITEMETHPSVTGDVTLSPGFYRIEDKNNYLSKFPATPAVSVKYQVSYYDLAFNEYDIAGRLVKNTQPLNSLNSINRIQSTTVYNSLGQVVENTSPDEGTARFKYRNDGQIRFSQNTEQEKIDKYSYTNYDYLARPVESGVYAYTAAGSVSFTNADAIVDLPDGLVAGQRSEQVFSVYDTPDTVLVNKLSTCMLPTAEYRQKFVAGNVSYTYTLGEDPSKTWYSYDVYGRVTFVVQEIESLGCVKTIDYEYDSFNGQLIKTIYQKHNKGERFVHRYQYNLAGQLEIVETSIDNINFTKQAHYKYNESGALIRTELATNLQGIDYIYNLNGQLKAINHPSILPANDPGRDGEAGGSGFLADVFGMGIDYYSGDYTRTGTPKMVSGSSSGTNQYNGNIKATRWNTQIGSATQKAYTYQYNRNGWLTEATFGTANSTGAITDNANGDYKVAGITYDANGNIQTLQRKGYTGGGTNSMDNLIYNYGTSSKANRLSFVKDTEDNPDPLRYDDIRSQENTTLGANGQPEAAANYIYNDLGQLVIDHQEGISYQYNSAGLVTKISQLSAISTGTFCSVDYEDFNASTNRKRFWVDPTTSEYCVTSIYFDQAMNCMELINNYGNLQQLTGTGSKIRNMRVVPGMHYKFEMDIVVDKILHYMLHPEDPNGLPPPEIAVDAWVVVNLRKPDGTIIGTQTIANQTAEYCERFFDGHVDLSFTAAADQEHITLELVVYNNQSGTPLPVQRILVDNMNLQVATSAKLGFIYNDRGHRIRKDSYHPEFNTIITTYYVRDVAGNPMGIYKVHRGTGTKYPLRLEENGVYGLGRIGTFSRDTSPQGGFTLYELTDNLGNVRAVIMKSGTNALVISAKSDYYPFGMAMPNATTGDYRYAFQGQEKDPETGMEAFELRLWDGRLGRWLTVDPYHEFYSPYVGMGNNPISLIDPDGGSTEGGGNCEGCPPGWILMPEYSNREYGPQQK